MNEFPPYACYSTEVIVVSVEGIAVHHPATIAELNALNDYWRERIKSRER